MGVVLLAIGWALTAALLVLCSAGFARVVERRMERKVALLRSEVDELRTLFVLRWDGLERSVNEGLAIAAKEAQAPPQPTPHEAERRFVNHAVALLSLNDALVLQTGQGRWYAVATKAGRC